MISIPFHGSVLMVCAWPGHVGHTHKCRGTARNCGQETSPPTVLFPIPRVSPEAFQNPSFSLHGPGTAGSTSFRIGRVGGIFTRNVQVRSFQSLRSMQKLVSPSGYSAIRVMHSCRTIES